MKYLCLGLLAHVDAGKTSLSEGLLYTGGSIRNIGRVDNKDSLLDNHLIERKRGITVFSKNAEFTVGNTCIQLIDTPGHADFSAEMERALSVLDYAVLIVSAREGVQSQTKILFKLLENRKIPTFIFINKMDYTDVSREDIIENIKANLTDKIIDFNDKAKLEESISLTSEELLDKFLENNTIPKEEIIKAIKSRNIFPLYSGSAISLKGIKELLEGLEAYTDTDDEENNNKAEGNKENTETSLTVYKLGKDEAGNKLAYIKVKSGELKVRQSINNEKVNQIRIYKGAKYESINVAKKGRVCAVTGLNNIGLGLVGSDENFDNNKKAVLSYDLHFAEEMPANRLLPIIKELNEELPELDIKYNKDREVLQCKIMGSVQLEVLQSLIKERYELDVEFLDGSIVYKETVLDEVIGVGHFEPLKHYAEVCLKISAGKRGAGVEVFSKLSEEEVPINFQKLILAHLKEKEHIGVLGGFGLTDVRIELIKARAHQKHTEGGDFREATYRAVRQGLMQAKSIILEPYYNFEIELPIPSLGRLLSDLSLMNASFEAPDSDTYTAKVRGHAPVIRLQNYKSELLAYTKGEGRINLEFRAYEPCHNEKEVLEKVNYDPELDILNPTGSVFCAKGSGFYVPWNEVFSYMHSDIGMKGEVSYEDNTVISSYDENKVTSEELMEIFERTYGKIKPRIGDIYNTKPKAEIKDKEYKIKHVKKLKEYIIVDGYNAVFASKDLSELANINIDAARDKLVDILSDYGSYKQGELIVVFDAYKVKGHSTEVIKKDNIYIVYTKEAETADQYIEKTVKDISKSYNVTVVTSDSIEQVIIRTSGCKLMSSRELFEDIDFVKREFKAAYLDTQKREKSYLLDTVDEKTKKELDKLKNEKN